ncbi:LacI family DNA-binding transcriptional regulator [Streptomyces sp. 110]|uniref:LacI family DNA-binding transcriptional regulator n=1 Tax=Streptomyces endocoffeicus TaxID=2898945 RepID=A0ABS1Q4T5_9ACTN|nr:LacI family DNA-binding transcriptional regulator [Streptomyces endocoffeicus]MBL1119672.1 LacI family DNA-binding transcriptional regulator [Streptomyces endocoffeicus]
MPNDQVAPEVRTTSPVTDSSGPPTRLRSTDIARLAGVSVSAVSLAFNGRPGLSDATRQRILDIAEELNWRPHRAARALKGASNEAIGIVIARPAQTLGVEPFFAQFLSGLQSRLSSNGIATQLLIVEDVTAQVAVYRRWAAERRVDGLVLLDLTVDDVRPQLVADLGIPAVVLGSHADLMPLTGVWVDDHAAMVSVLEYLVSLGHGRIGYVTGITSYQHTQRRLQTVDEGRATLGIDVTCVATDYSDAQGALATRRLMEAAPRCTAIIYDNDIMAAAGLGVLTEMGVQVPGEVSIVSFDDSVLMSLTHPPITALTRDTFALGELTATELLRVVADRPAPRAVQAPTPRLIVRGSTAPPESALRGEGAADVPVAPRTPRDGSPPVR